MNFQRANCQSRKTGLKLTAMIDVVFLLLIFFVAATRFRTPESELPAYMGHGDVIGRAEPLILTLRAGRPGADGVARPVIRVDGKTVSGAGSRDPMSGLEAVLNELAAQEGVREQVPVIIDADPDVAYGWVIQALNLCRKAQFSTVCFAASRRYSMPAIRPTPSG